MNAAVIPLRPSLAQVEEAWSAYDVAQRHVLALYEDPASSSRDRFEASMEALRLHKHFTQLGKRMEGG